MDPTRVVLAASELSLGLVVGFFTVAFGLVAGSFVNVLIFRLPRDRPVVSPRSHCFCCGTPLEVADLVPLLAYLRGGRCCRYCGVALSGQYLWVEAVVGALFGALLLRFGFGVGTIVYAAVGAMLAAAFVIDLRHRIIPGLLPLVIAVAGLLGSLIVALAPDLGGDALLPSPGDSLAGLVVGYLVFEGIVRLGRRLFGQEAMGGGDVLLAAALGTLLGPGRQFAAFFLVSILAGALFAVGLVLGGRYRRRMAMAFGPFLIIGAAAVLFAPGLGDWVARLYGFG